MYFENKIQQWVQLDNQLKKLNEQVKQLREQRNSIESNLTSYAKTNDLKQFLIINVNFNQIWVNSMFFTIFTY